MELSQTACGVSLGSDKPPLGKLVKRFKGSVELWKAKYRQVKSEIKRYQNRANDARRSRDRWKQQSPQWKASCEQLQTESAFLVPPSQRSNARSMNLCPIMKWDRQHLGITLKSKRRCACSQDKKQDETPPPST